MRERTANALGAPIVQDQRPPHGLLHWPVTLEYALVLYFLIRNDQEPCTEQLRTTSLTDTERQRLFRRCCKVRQAGWPMF